MLRSHGSRNQPFVCWDCLTRSSYAKSERSNSAIRSKLSNISKATIARRFLYSTKRNNAVVENRSVPIRRESFRPYMPPVSPNSEIRKQLRQWEDTNAAKFIPENQPGNLSLSQVIDVYNNSNLTPGLDVQFENPEDYRDLTQDEVTDAARERNFLRPGDLVELHANGRRDTQLAIFIREVDRQYQFYSITGGWIHRTGTSVSIFFPNFVEPQDLDAIRPYLPQQAVPTELENRLHHAEQPVSRDIGGPLLRKMGEFLNEANAAFKLAADALESAHTKVAHPTVTYYLTLPEIADKILSGVFPKNEHGTFSTPVLYALHRSLISQDELFRASDLSIRAETQYEINPISTVEAVQRVVQSVRQYRDKIKFKSQNDAESTDALSSFILKASHLIDLSRAQREFTPYGNVGPISTYTESQGNFRDGVQQDPFTDTDIDFIVFLELWSGRKSFSPGSYLNGIGSVILRAINRYGIDEIELGQRTAWTFLKEIGAISPWKTAAEYQLGVPHSTSRVGLPSLHTRSEFVGDRVEKLRKNWDDLTVFCVDDTYAHELDDGISLEATESSNEYWVHTHVADPASHLDPQSKSVKRAEVLTETLYLPDLTVPLLDSEYIMNNLSLQSKRPCLTFSAKMDLNGNILETKITPGRIFNVLFMTPATFKEVGVGETPSPQNTYVVGPEVPPPPVSRPLVNKSQLTENQKQDIRILHQIAQARLNRQRERGAVSYIIPRCSISTSFPSSPWSRLEERFSLEYPGDPTIRLTVPRPQQDGTFTGRDAEDEGVNAVACFMQMAGEVASTWCHERGIPIPYRSTLRSPDKPDPSLFFSQVVLPTIKKAGQPPLDILLQYFSLTGSAQVSTTPSPHFTLGMDMYTRCTSPLRRYLDLVVQFQIHAALLEEHRTGSSLVGNSKDDFLPFSRVNLDKILSTTARSEKRIKQYSKGVQAEWILQFLLRAWKFSKSALPSPFVFAVSYTNPRTGYVHGTLPHYLIGARMEPPQWMQLEDIKSGDYFEVAIQDLDIPDRRLIVRPVRSLLPDEISKDNDSS